VLIPSLGPIIYRYDHEQAVKDHIIPPFHLKRIAVHLRGDEKRKYEEYSEEIRNLHRVLVKEFPQLDQVYGEKFFKILGSLIQRYNDPILHKYTTLVNLRKAIVHTSRNKMKALAWVIENELTSSTKTLIFHERINSADEIFHYLKEKSFSVVRYHSQMKLKDKKKALRAYREDKAQILVACTALDEGLDVPATSAGIIVAATSSIRQRIQRIGRILRRAPGKDHSLVYSVFVQGIEDDIFTDSVMRKLEEVAERVEYLNLG
jgi:superfamily II DNA or RNA helicase